MARGGEVSEGVTVVELESTYFWRPVEDTDFTVGVVVATNDKSETLGQQSVPSGMKRNVRIWQGESYQTETRETSEEEK